MKGCLLMRESPAQIYCANTLFRRGVIDRVVLEEGTAIEPDGRELRRKLRRFGPGGIAARVARDLAFFGGNPLTCMDYYWTRLDTRSLMNRRTEHEARILGSLGNALDAGLPVTRVGSVNDPACEALLRDRGYRLVFVFGTGLLKPPLLTLSDAVFVNLHWGLAPRYRGEGIISALAEEGTHGLGVTVHVIDEGVDSGPVLHQERLTPEPGDNVYAIGLKLTVLGVQGFLRVHDDFLGAGLRRAPQDDAHSRTYRWRDLKADYRRLRAAQHALNGNRGQTPFGRKGSDPFEMPEQVTHRLKSWLASGAVLTGGAARARQRQGTRLRILMYHGVVARREGPAAYDNLFLSAAAFARHLRHLRRAFRVLSLQELLGCLDDRRPFPDRAALITFDDGYQNNLSTALPILEEYRLPATVFLSSAHTAARRPHWFDLARVLVHRASRDHRRRTLGEGFVVDGSRLAHPGAAFRRLCAAIQALDPQQAHAVHRRLHEIDEAEQLLEGFPEFAVAGWEEWRAAMAGGLISVGSHSVRHEDLARLPADARDEALRQSKREIEGALGAPCRALAYPHGRWDADVAQAARSAGYACALTTDQGLNDTETDRFALRRTMIGDHGDHHLFCARVSGAWDTMRDGRGADAART